MKLIDRIKEANEALAKDLVKNDEELDIVAALLDELPEPIREDLVKRIFTHLHAKIAERERDRAITARVKAFIREIHEMEQELEQKMNETAPARVEPKVTITFTFE